MAGRQIRGRHSTGRSAQPDQRRTGSPPIQFTAGFRRSRSCSHQIFRTGETLLREARKQRLMTGSLFISGLDWILPASAFLLAALVLLFWGSPSFPATGGVRSIFFLWKLLGVLALAACLLEPLWTAKRAKPGANY